MKAIIFLFSIILMANASAFEPDLVIEKLKREDDPAVVLNQLKQLQKDNIAFIKKLHSDRSYEPDLMAYSLTLKALLRPVRKDIRCQYYVDVIKDSFKAEWSELENPTHDLWPVIQKICK